MAKCKDCLHGEVCRYYTNELAKANGIPLKVEEIEGLLECGDCEHFKGRSRFVELPCKAGDTFFVIIESSDILEYKVFYISILCGEVYDEIEIVLDRNYHRIKYTKGRFEYELGKTIFFTEEEAEQALKERERIE